MANQIEIDLSRTQPFEACAALVAVLAHPKGDDESRGALMASLCHLVLKGSFLGGVEAVQTSERPTKPLYAFRSDAEVQRDLKKVRRLLRDRMIAAQMALPLIMRAEGTLPAKLPEGLSKLSLNELAIWAMRATPRPEDEDIEPESGNVETRIWRPSLPVIHLAAALAVIMQENLRAGGGEIGMGELLNHLWITEMVAERADHYAALIGKGGVLPGRPVDLVTFRLAPR